ncbi:hypothetical protein Scep_024104 [Stephania cephalantha]|uniref:Uncharacterized protein n=1 Tax=Stephania cephalantha TaxID=152367 RepID=A0AAP0F4V2_9MAGN
MTMVGIRCTYFMASNLIYVDQPTGMGFSYGSDKRDLRQNETGVSNDLYDFLQHFSRSILIM